MMAPDFLNGYRPCVGTAAVALMNLPCPFVDRGLECEDVTTVDWLTLFTEAQDE